MEKDWLSLLIKHFDLVDETPQSLFFNVSIRELSSKRVVITKNPFCGFSNIVGGSIHKEIVNAFKKYADDTALEKYMKAEGWKYEPKKNITTILANTFLIFECNSIYDIQKYVNKIYSSRCDMFEFEQLDDKHFIAYD